MTRQATLGGAQRQAAGCHSEERSDEESAGNGAVSLGFLTPFGMTVRRDGSE
ncbi:MAG: hypothetical protein ACI3ZL_04725 [Candidatus Cryptobacteroides sp.]